MFWLQSKIGKELLNYRYVTSPFVGENIINNHICVFVTFQINIEQQAGEYCADQSGSPGLYIAIFLTHIRSSKLNFLLLCYCSQIFYYLISRHSVIKIFPVLMHHERNY